MKNVDRKSIFDGLSQAMDRLQPEQIQPILDRVLVRDVAEVEKVGLLFIPQTAKEQGIGKNGLYRRGVVVSVGPGDKFKELGFSESGMLRRKRVTCPGCSGSCNQFLRADGFVEDCAFPCRCDGTGLGRLPIQVKIGDMVIYDRFKQSEITIKGVRHSLINLEQAIFAVMEGSTVRVLNDRILVQYAEQETETAGGIAIPESAQEKPRIGTVVAAGPGLTDVDGNVIPLDVKVGDTVLFGNYAGTEIEVDGEKFLLMKEDAVLGVVA